MTKNELRQLVREAIQELKEEANTKELQKLGFKLTKSDVNEVQGYVFGPMELQTIGYQQMLSPR